MRAGLDRRRTDRMENRPFGATRRAVAAIGQRTWEMAHERAAAMTARPRGLDAGRTHLDSAEMYGAGAVEEVGGEAIAGRRGQVFLASKVQPENASRSGAIAACERSLARLRTDHLGLYLRHWP